LPFCAAPIFGAADTIQPLKIKPGLWETASTWEKSGQALMPAKAEEAMAEMREELAKMPPGERAKVEEMMKANASQAQKPTVGRRCLRMEDFGKPFKLDDIAKSCTGTLLSSSSSKREMRLHAQLKE
jgi:hypothetical protein